MKKDILTLSDKIRFECAPGNPCFTKCCQDVNIILTPYDIIRMKNALGISSEKFLDQYTLIIYKEKKLLPMVLLKMNEKDKKCPFVSKHGCRIYNDRPWACRMFPLEAVEEKTYRIIADEDLCLGLRSDKEWSISQWVIEQGVAEYDHMNRDFFKIVDSLKRIEPEMSSPSPRLQDMLCMCLYNLDKFREFIVTTTFLHKFDIDLHKVNRLMTSDIELFEFAIDWIKFGMFGEPTLKLRGK